jgi:hypothetical protein
MRQLYISILLLMSTQSLANTDEVIKLTDGGELVGFPSEYQPAKFDLSSYTLQIGKNKVKLPECISRYFDHSGSSSINIRSSWFSKRVPNYIHMQIQPKGRDYLFRLTFILQTLLPMKFEISTPYGKAAESGYRSSYNHELKIQDYCLDDFNVESV